MRAYVLTTGIIFGIVALGQLVQLVIASRSASLDAWFAIGIAVEVFVTAALSVWAFRLLQTRGSAAA